MKKYSLNDSVSSDSRPRLPRIKNFIYSNLPSTSPTNSGNSSLLNASFANNSHSFALKIPPKGPIIPLPKLLNISKQEIDLESLEEYRRCEIFKCRKICCDKYPFWYMNSDKFFSASVSEEFHNAHDDYCKNRSEFQQWISKMSDKVPLSNNY